MASRSIVTFPNPVLKQKCAEVSNFGPELHRLLDDMAETMAMADGIGLAANQVAVPWRVIVMDIPVDRQAEVAANSRAPGNDDDGQTVSTGLIELVNPRLTAMRGEIRYEEGCLSFPGMHEVVTRAAEIDLVYQDRDGGEHAVTAAGLVAICVQHEIDHLEGITFIDRLSPLKRRVAMREYLRARAAAEVEEQRTARCNARRAAG
jgi:peptide deformylase